MSATNTYMTYLMHGTGTGTVTYEKLLDITSFPDMGEDPDLLETTTLSDPMQTFILGIIQMGSGLSFEANYDKTTFTALKALENKTEKYALWFGGSESGGVVTPDGSNGKFSFDGQLSVRVLGAGVNEVRKMSILIAPSTPIDFE